MKHTSPPNIVQAGKKPLGVTLAAALLMAFLAYQLSIAVREGLAWLYALPANQLMDQWQLQADALENATEENTEAATFAPNPAEWQAVLTNAQQALAMAPNNPVYYANLGRLYQFKLNDKNLDIRDIEEAGAKSLQYFEKAAQLRPTWVYYWWDIALTEYELFHDHTATYHNALQNITRYGPWIDAAQLFSADLALETWYSLNPITKQYALDNIDRALQRQAKAIIEVIEQHTAWNIICYPKRQNDKYPNIANLCDATY